MFSVIIYALASLGLIVSAIKDRQRTLRALGIAWKSFLNILPSMLGIIALIGLVITIIPSSFIATYFGSDSWSGILISSLIGAITIMPAFIAFPLASSLLTQGAGASQVMAFITTLMMVGFVTAPLEKRVFGQPWTVWRNGLGIVFAVIIALVAGVLL